MNGHRLILAILHDSYYQQKRNMAENGTHKIGKRLMANVVDDIAEGDPERTVCIMPEKTDSSESFVNLNFRQLAHAVNYMSWWIEKSFGRHNSSPQETLTYLGANDARYLIIVMACNKTGYQVSGASTWHLRSSMLTSETAITFLHSELSGGAAPPSGNDRLLKTCV